MPQVDLRRSPIAGHGLFAAVALFAEAAVLRQTGVGRLNHSCDPNLGWAGPDTLVAVREIPAETELTIDYSTVIDDPDFAMVCHCDTYRCRQMIEGTDWQIPQLQRRYAGRWSPSIQRRIDESAR